MREGLRRWSEDATVGKALLVAGGIMLLVQVLPWDAVRFVMKLWPLALVLVGIRIIADTRRSR